MGLRGGFEWDGGTWKKRLIINTAALTRLPGMGLEIPQASEASMQWFKPSQVAPTLNYRPADYVRDILTKCPRTTEGEPQTHLKWPVVVIVVNWFRLHEALSNVKWFAMSWCNSCSVSTHWSYQVDLLMKNSRTQWGEPRIPDRSASIQNPAPAVHACLSWTQNCRQIY